MNTPPAVRVRHLSHRFGSTQAIRDLSFDVERGEILGLFGEQAAGKSTALRAVATLLEPTGGRIEIAGVDVAVEPERARRRMGYWALGAGSYGELTVEEYLSFFAAAYRLHPIGAAERALAIANLTGLRNDRMSTLPDGARERVHLAKALLHDPELLILDEPGTELDAASKEELFAVLGALHANGKTLLMASRVIANLTGFCTSVLELRNGQLAPAGSRRTDPPPAQAPTSPRLARPDGFGARLAGPDAFGARLAGPDAFGARLAGPDAFGARLWHFRVLGSADAAAGLARALANVGRAEAVGNELTLEIDGGEGSVAGIVRSLVEAGVGITGVRPEADEADRPKRDAREAGA